MRTILLIMLILSISINGFAQIKFEERVELKINWDTYDGLIKLGESGFIVKSKKADFSRKNLGWKFEKYNADIELVKTEDVSIPGKFNRGVDFINTKGLHYLFIDKANSFVLLNIDAATFEITKTTGVFPKNVEISDIVVLGKMAYCRALTKSKHFLFAINLKTGNTKELPVKFEDYGFRYTYPIGLQVLEDSNEVLAFYKVRKTTKRCDVFAVCLNAKGDVKSSRKITEGVEKNIITITGSKVDEDSYIYTGTYSTKHVDISEGVYFCNSNKGKVSSIEYYNYIDLENFTSYMPEAKQAKVEYYHEAKQKKGKELTLKYMIADHEIIQLEDGYLFLGEAYFNTYKRTSTTSDRTTNNGSTVSSTSSDLDFDGFQYSHAFLCKYDLNGKIVWDEMFELKTKYKPRTERRFVSIIEQSENTIRMAYGFDGKIISNAYDFDGNVVDDELSKFFESYNEADKDDRSRVSISHWYGNYFLSIEYRKNKKSDNNPKNIFAGKVKF